MGIDTLGSIAGGIVQGMAVADLLESRKEQREFNQARKDLLQEQIQAARQKREDDKALREALNPDGPATASPGSPAATFTPVRGLQRVTPQMSADPNAAGPLDGVVPQQSRAPMEALPADHREVADGLLVFTGRKPLTPAQTQAFANVSDDDYLARYTATVVPRVTKELLRQGKVDEAKKFQEFSDSQEGRAYARDWSKALRLVTIGNFEAARPLLQRVYGRVPDNQSVKIDPLGDGSRWNVTFTDNTTGAVLHQQEGGAAELARMGVLMLSPEKLVEWQSKQVAETEKANATLDRQIELEGLRQKGQEERDNRRDERLRLRLDAMDRGLEKRLAAQERRGRLTLQQQRQNEEIEAARELIVDLSPEAIRRRTTPTTATGRENPDFDPQLARAVKLATRRKIGDDPWFDQRQGRQPPADSLAGKPLAEMTEGQLQAMGRQASPLAKQKIDAELARRSLAGMPGMQGHRLGEFVEGKGWQVFDSQGQLVSYLRKR